MNPDSHCIINVYYKTKGRFQSLLEHTAVKSRTPKKHFASENDYFILNTGSLVEAARPGS